MAHHLCVLVAGRWTSLRQDSLVPTALSIAAGKVDSKLVCAGTTEVMIWIRSA